MAPTTIEPAAATPRGTKTTKRGAVAPTPGERLLWRAVVRTGGTFGAGRERDRIEWHLADCAAPRADGSHCTEGEHLIETTGHPDGHCLVDGRCGRCGQTVRQAETVRKAA